MIISKLIDKLRYHNFSDKVYVQVGFNRFDVKTVDITNDGVIIIVEDDANNPPASYINPNDVA